MLLLPYITQTEIFRNFLQMPNPIRRSSMYVSICFKTFYKLYLRGQKKKMESITEFRRISNPEDGFTARKRLGSIICYRGQKVTAM